MKTWFVDERVKQEVTKDRQLFQAWVQLFNVYDHELDPFHNKDWVKKQISKEQRKLTIAKNTVIKVNELFKKIK